ncbi:uncharacterized protein V1516DRAFT_689850 [Lipomyces oligophaga]|uniref:uncharacterized protein n=1 Tax=Lipomyces oligophaga TaxID=45792 RepID=UPI0034CFD25F
MTEPQIIRRIPRMKTKFSEGLKLLSNSISRSKDARSLIQTARVPTQVLTHVDVDSAVLALEQWNHYSKQIHDKLGNLAARKFVPSKPSLEMRRKAQDCKKLHEFLEKNRHFLDRTPTQEELHTAIVEGMNRISNGRSVSRPFLTVYSALKHGMVVDSWLNTKYYQLRTEWIAQQDQDYFATFSRRPKFTNRAPQPIINSSKF